MSYRLLTRFLKGRAEVYGAGTLNDARVLVQEHPNADAIALGGSLGGNELDTLPFIREVRATGFRGPIITVSGVSFYQNEMVHVGCSHRSEKHRLAWLLIRLFNL